MVLKLFRKLMHGLKVAGIELDRKVLADLAVHQPETFLRKLWPRQRTAFAERTRRAGGWPEVLAVSLFYQG